MAARDPVGEVSPEAVLETRKFFPCTPGLGEVHIPEGEVERNNGVNTDLGLLHDPYNIKKKLTKSDINNNQARLLIPVSDVRRHILLRMNDDRVAQLQSGGRVEVIVWDADESKERRLVFRWRESSKHYVLMGGWVEKFVRQRRLAVGDEIGIFWDSIDNKFRFSCLSRAN